MDLLSSQKSRGGGVFSYLPHDSDGGLSCGMSHPVLHQVEHVLIVQQADQVEGAEAGCAAQSQVSDDHGAARKKRKKKLNIGGRNGEKTALHHGCQF